MSYNPVGRNLLKVYKKGLNDKDNDFFVDTSKIEGFSKSYILEQRGGIPKEHLINDSDVKIKIPIIEIGFPVKNRKGCLDLNTLTEIEPKNFSTTNIENITTCGVLDNVSYNKYVESISCIEDSEIFACIHASVSDSRTIIPNNEFGLSHLNCCVSLIENHGYEAKNILIHPEKYRHMLSWGIDALGKEYCDEIIKTGNLSKILNIKINVSNRINKRHIYVLADEEKVGGVYINKDVNLISYFDNKTKSIEFVIEEEVGFCVFRDYCITKICCPY